MVHQTGTLVMARVGRYLLVIQGRDHAELGLLKAKVDRRGRVWRARAQNRAHAHSRPRRTGPRGAEGVLQLTTLANYLAEPLKLVAS